MSIVISQAILQDTSKIMKFMNDIWKEGHILSSNKGLFLYDFQDNDKLNFIIAKDENKNIVGIFGFIKYNNSNNPDIAGSLWKVDPKVKEPFLGLKLREYFINNIHHDFFAAPGAGLQTRPIYKVINMNWNIMEQYYIANKNISDFHLIKNPIIRKINASNKKNVQIKKAYSIEELKEFIFEYNTVPLKDINYIQKRFFQHPIYNYDILYLLSNKQITNIFVCRKVYANSAFAYRIVDFYGELDFIENIVEYLYNYILEKNIEYIDFISYGYNSNILQNAGFNLVDFKSNTTIVPNYFEPFVQKNVPIYCVSDRTDKHFRQHKADGDQDRPSEYRNNLLDIKGISSSQRSLNR